MAAKKKQHRKPAYLSVRRRWTRNPQTQVQANAKAKERKSRCRGKVKPGSDMCAAA